MDRYIDLVLGWGILTIIDIMKTAGMTHLVGVEF